MLYPLSVVGRFNHSQIKVFERSQAAYEFLFPVGMSVRRLPPKGFIKRGKLSSAEERNLFRAFHYLKYRVHRRLTDGREVKTDVANLLAVRDRLVKANTGLVIHIVLTYCDNDEKPDMQGEAELSLLRCVCGFDPWLGLRFHKYASVAIRNAIYRCRAEENKHHNRIKPIPVDHIAVARPEREALQLPMWMLSERQQEVVACRLSGMKFREIAEKMNIRTSTCQRHYSVAIEALRRAEAEIDA